MIHNNYKEMGMGKKEKKLTHQQFIDLGFEFLLDKWNSANMSDEQEMKLIKLMRKAWDRYKTI